MALAAPPAAFPQLQSGALDAALTARWRADQIFGGAAPRPGPRLGPVVSSPRVQPLRRGIIGGLIGAVAGVAVCTVISNVFFNEGAGLSTCTTKGNVLFAAGGFAAGFAVGWLGAPRY